ncbi:hypothetical protein [Actinacidiphila acididurans]|uniref:Uncharacterized protein n=1 Tax=Actinacidiphila acididurans TaxID=2784346 RepID=A0ABS2U6I9_9ACTN|nr:hypothetical protein [Actinacidiphila acididurans]MBM9510637.1 hypothetical protein [Actinacidiphila acididurans]
MNGQQERTGEGAEPRTAEDRDDTRADPSAAGGAAGASGAAVEPRTEVLPARADGAAELDRLGRRMERAVGGFVDDPRRAVKEADAVLEEAAERLARLLAERRRTLRASWHADDGSRADTEELRVALTRYRDMTRQLLTVA